MHQSLKDYVINPNNEYKCGICFELLNDPKQCNQCQNYFCSNCLDKWLSNSPKYKCPYRCNKHTNFLYASLDYISKIKKLKYNCPNIQKGCKMNAQYSIMKKHMEICGNQKNLCLICKSKEDCISIDCNHHVICQNCINSILESSERWRLDYERHQKEIGTLQLQLTNAEKQHRLYVNTHKAQHEQQLNSILEKQKEQEAIYLNKIQEQKAQIERLNKKILVLQFQLEKNSNTIFLKQSQNTLKNNRYHSQSQDNQNSNRNQAVSKSTQRPINKIHMCQNFYYRQSTLNDKCKFCDSPADMYDKYKCMVCFEVICQKCV